MGRFLDCGLHAFRSNAPAPNANWRGFPAYSDFVALSMSIPRACAPVTHILGSPSTTLGTQLRQMENDAYRGA